VTTNKVRFKEEPAPGQPPISEFFYLSKWYVGDVEEIQVTVKEKKGGDTLES